MEILKMTNTNYNTNFKLFLLIEIVVFVVLYLFDQSFFMYMLLMFLWSFALLPLLNFIRDLGGYKFYVGVNSLISLYKTHGFYVFMFYAILLFQTAIMFSYFMSALIAFLLCSVMGAIIAMPALVCQRSKVNKKR